MTAAAESAATWQTIREGLRPLCRPNVFEAWVRPTSGWLDNDRYVVESPQAAVRNWLAANMRDNIFRLLRETLGEQVTEVTFTVRAASAVAADSSAETEAATAAPFAPPAKIAAADSGGVRADLTFDNFVRGRANEMAIVAARQLCNKNIGAPLLYLYGATGLGKTHLLHAIGNHFRAAGQRVRYIPAADFISEVVAAYRNQRLEAFKERYRRLDVLLADDIQFLAKKTASQEEFFAIINAFMDAGKHLAVTCDQYPRHLQDMQGRLVSRFTGGLSAEVSPPEYDLRLAIVERKAADFNLPINEDAREFVARVLKSSVRELEGALRRLLAYHAFKNEVINLAVCKDALADILGARRVAVDVPAVLRQVAEFYGVRAADLLGARRTRAVTRPRHVAMFLAREVTPASLSQIGRAFNNRSHATVFNAIERVDKSLATDAALGREINALRAILKA